MEKKILSTHGILFQPRIAVLSMDTLFFYKTK